MVQNFRQLRVWARAQELAVATRALGRAFPRSGFGDLRAQMIRAAESTLFNIAEGCGASTPREFARFLGISSKSTMELESQLDLARAYGIISAEKWSALIGDTATVRRMIWGLRARVLTSADSPDNGHVHTDNSKRAV